MAIPTIHKLDPAYRIVERLGGKREVAAKLGLDKSTLSRWCQPAPRGTGGCIPQRYWKELLALANDRQARITVEDLSSVRS